MKNLNYFCFLVAIVAQTQCTSIRKENKNGSQHLIRKDFSHFFKECGVDGSVVIYDINEKNWILSDTESVQLRTLPASTFKIPNLLIALETKTIQSENEISKWIGNADTLKYGYRPEIYTDMSIQKAFEVSAGWVFTELAKKIGRKHYQKYLKLSNYGNQNFSQEDVDFWNFGNFAISPLEQVEFLHKLYEYRLPFHKENIDIVKKVMLTEQTHNYIIRAKTGWTRDKNMNTGWWIGFIETKQKNYIFATRLLQDRQFKRDDFGECRKSITKKILRELTIID